MTRRLQGKRVIFTGGVTNIGREVVELFQAEGARMVVADIDRDAGRALAEALGDGVNFVHVDVTDEDSVRRMIEAGVETLGGLDVLCQNAGAQRSGKVTEFAAEDWDMLFRVNARAHFFGAKYAVPHLRKAGKGAIVNTSSLAGQRGGGGMTAYSATKGAVIAFSTALAIELAPDNIRVNTICPGWVDTPFNKPAIDFMGGRGNQDDIVARTVPLGRQAHPSEMAPLFVYLASDESSYMTAQAITIDGGVYN
ncbi:SDR family NAD(P)-dependent oxidoreductase [Defluviimonas sp. SAOS-178_SWC]|uniref:SDR family NAD(P)-dependent oxidoreductase n=1 Tax=Defluviimonas sp. SAOS-178_SWC TaxID=3121287 RepID=UPI0032221409